MGCGLGVTLRLCLVACAAPSLDGQVHCPAWRDTCPPALLPRKPPSPADTCKVYLVYARQHEGQKTGEAVLLPFSSALTHHHLPLPRPCCSVKEKAGMGPSSAREDLKQGEAQEAEAPLGVCCGQLQCATLMRSAGMTT